jgi:hypothetical protein
MRLVAGVEPVVHRPELALERRRLGGGRGGQRMGMQLGQREVPEGEHDPPVEPAHHLVDDRGRRPAVRAFEVAVLDQAQLGAELSSPIGGWSVIVSSSAGVLADGRMARWQ